MRIPSIASLKKVASNIISHTETPVFEAPGSRETGRRSRKFGRPSASRHWFQDAAKPAPGERNEEDRGVEERASTCPRGKAFYRCANGFQGCCSHDPCNPGGACRDGEKASHQKENSKTPTHAQDPTPHVTAHHSSVTHSQPHDHHTPTVTDHTPQHTSTHEMSHTTHQSGTSSTASILSANPTTSSPSTTFSGPVMSGTPPACPGGNGTHYTDSTKVEYVIHCDMENTYVSYNAIFVSVGGYSQCFSACSKTDACGGFTFVGSVSGNCYVKSQMPNNSYVTHDGDNYVTAAKANPPHNSGGGSTTTPKKAGIIAGAVLGSLLLLGLLLFCLACCAKRHRKKVEERRATITHVTQGPIEMQPYRPPTDHSDHDNEARLMTSTNLTEVRTILPQRTLASGRSIETKFETTIGSDVRFVGTFPGKLDTAAKANTQVGSSSGSGLVGLEQTLRGNSNGEVRPESGFVPIILPASMYSPPHRDEQPEPKSLRGASTIDSPTLGIQPGYGVSLANDVRRNQHLARTLPPRSTSFPVSPDVDNRPRDGGFKVSPVESGGIRWREV